MPGVPCQPILFEFPHRYFDPSLVNGGPDTAELLIRCMMQVYNSFRVTILPVYKPNKEEIADSRLYSENVRKHMAKEMKVGICDFSFDDVSAMVATAHTQAEPHGSYEADGLRYAMGQYFRSSDFQSPFFSAESTATESENIGLSFVFDSKAATTLASIFATADSPWMAQTELDLAIVKAGIVELEREVPLYPKEMKRNRKGFLTLPEFQRVLGLNESLKDPRWTASIRLYHLVSSPLAYVGYLDNVFFEDPFHLLSDYHAGNTNLTSFISVKDHRFDSGPLKLFYGMALREFIAISLFIYQKIGHLAGEERTGVSHLCRYSEEEVSLGDLLAWLLCPLSGAPEKWTTCKIDDGTVAWLNSRLSEQSHTKFDTIKQGILAGKLADAMTRDVGLLRGIRNSLF